VDRLACVDLPAFPLQLLLRRHPDWKQHAVVVVDEDKPNGVIMWANERARASRILPGHRYASGLALDGGLRAGEVSSGEIQAGMDEVAALLRTFSPEVDPCSGEPGVFWADVSGLERLYPSLDGWGRRVQRALTQVGLFSAVVVGFTRFGTYAVAREVRRGVTTFARAEDEREAARRVKLERLDLEPTLRDMLDRLGVTTLGAFLRLPPGGLLERFGNEAHRLHRLAAGERWDPLQPRQAPEPIEQSIFLDHAERDSERLLFTIKRLLGPLLAQLARNQAALATLFIELTFERTGHGVGKKRLDAIRPAEPTLDALAILRLVHLRLEASPPEAAVKEVLISAEDVCATHEQLSLFTQRPRRDLRAANEAFARLRAELGDDAVVRAELREGHLPEARYEWLPLEAAVFPMVKPRAALRPLVRRVRDKPLLLPVQDNHVRDDGWLLRGLEAGPVTKIVGPYIVSGGWWASEVHREYHFAETRRGECLWVYFDRRRRRWFLHGQVE
jgi:protein ImuB